MSRHVARFRAAFAGTACLLLASTAHAATAGGEGGWDWKTLGLAALNFTVLIVVLLRVGGKPIRDFMYQRSQAIRQELGKAQTALAAAQAEVAELRSRLDQITQEAGEMLASTQEQAESEAARLCARAEETAERIRADAERVASVEVDRARRVLREEAVALATQMANELLRSQLTPKDDERLVDEFIERAGATTH